MNVSALSSRDHLFGLDMLRLFAACLVVLDHFGSFSAVRPDVGFPFAFPYLNFMARFGWVGVEIFFVISGFVIALSAKDETTSGFIKRRFIRLWPALAVCSSIGAVALWIGAGEPTAEILNSFIRSITLFPAGPYVDGVIWSLIVEAVFYLLITLVLFRQQFHNLDRYATALGCISAGFLSISAALLLYDPTIDLQSAFTLYERFVFKFTLLRYGVFFSLGMTLWLCFEFGFTPAKKLLCIVWAGFCVLEIAMHAASDHTLAAFAARISLIEAMLLPAVVWGASLGIFLFSVFYREKISAVVDGRLVKKLGVLTYVLYLNHYTLGRVVVYKLSSANVAPQLILASAMLLIFGLSWLIISGPEPSIQRWLRRLLHLGASDRKPRGDGHVPFSV